MLACSSPAADRVETPLPAPPVPIDAGVDAAPVIDAGPPLDEVGARVLLAERFRAAGLRVRYDVRVSGDGYDLTADGYDPERRIGFEYVAPAELAADLAPGEADRIEADAHVRILVLGPADRATVEAAAEAFLARVRPADAGPA